MSSKSIIMRYLFSLIILSGSMIATAQVQLPKIPLNEDTKLITYDGVVNQTGVSAKELYTRFNNWYTKFYPNPTEKVRKKDDENNTVDLFIRLKLSNVDKKGIKTDSGELLQYSFNVSCRDGRYRYEFTKFNLKAASYKPIEYMMDPKDPNAEKHANWLKQMDEEIKRTINELEKAMASSGEKKKDDW